MRIVQVCQFISQWDRELFHKIQKFLKRALYVPFKAHKVTTFAQPFSFHVVFLIQKRFAKISLLLKRTHRGE